MPSTTSRGNYYKRRTKLYYEAKGYVVQFTEFTCALVIKGRPIYRKIDIFGSDGIAMNSKEIIFWNSKATDPSVKDGVSKMKSAAKIEFAKYPFPNCVILEAVVWEPRKAPQVFRFNLPPPALSSS